MEQHLFYKHVLTRMIYKFEYLLQMEIQVLNVILGVVFALQLRGLDENSENYEKIAGKIFNWSISYLSLLSVLLVAAQLLKA